MRHLKMSRDRLTFTLLDLGYKKAGPVQIYDSSTCYSDGSIIPFSAQLAIVTHALTLRGEKVAHEDPLSINSQEGQPMYEYKLKQFLLAFALGMTVSSPWNGSFNANGGYIVVKEDGEVICYHFFDCNDFEEYLFNNTKFDTPSATRHMFGKVYKVADNYFIKLNLQIRFTK